MGIKEFLKPTILKIILTIIFIVVSLLFVYFPAPLWIEESNNIATIDFYTNIRGFPIPYLIINIGGGVVQGFSIFYFGLLIDLIFWYLLSCLIIFIYNKVGKNKNKRKK